MRRKKKAEQVLEHGGKRSVSVPGPRALLVELASTARFASTPELPFIHAFLKKQMGLETLWIRFGLDPALLSESNVDGVGLDQDESARLMEHAARFRPTHVLFSNRPADSLWRMMAELHPDLSGGVWKGGGSADPTALDEEERSSMKPISDPCTLHRWLCADAGRAAVKKDLSPRTLIPDFGFLCGNNAAEKMEPFVTIMTGAGCTRQKASAQMAAFYDTFPFPPNTLRAWVRLAGFAIREVKRLIEELARGEPKALALDLLMDASPDLIIKHENQMDTAAGLLRQTGHKLHIRRVGVESFSRRELDRMNPGVQPWQNLAAIRVLKRLETRNPKTFCFQERGGSPMIMFTPWTTLEDLAVNIAVMRHFRLQRSCDAPFFLYQRLHEGLPLTDLARRDSLLIETSDDPARRSADPGEIHWRFKHPEVASLCRIMLRIPKSKTLFPDPLYQRVQEWIHSGPSGIISGVEGSDEMLGRVEILIRRAMAASEPLSAEELLDEPAAAFEPAAGSSKGYSSKAVPEAERLLSFQKAGLCRVNRVESASADDVLELKRLLKREKRSFEVQPSGGGHFNDLFFGESERDVAEAVKLTKLLLANNEPKAREKAIRRVGRLFGYPSCCARSFASANSFLPNTNEWLILLRRSEKAGPVDPLLNPFVSIHHVPCSFRCRQSIELARAMRSASRPEVREWEERIAPLPILFLLDRPGQFVGLSPIGPVGRRFDFETMGRTGGDPRLKALEPGGTIGIDEGEIVVHRNGARVASFFLTAAVFWPEAAFDPRFWRLCATEALERQSELPATGDMEESGDRKAKATAALASKLAALLRSVGHDLQARGLSVLSVEPGLGRHVTVTLRHRFMVPDDELVIHVEPLEGAGRYFAAVGDLAVSYSEKTPLVSTVRKHTLALFIERLGKPVSRR